VSVAAEYGPLNVQGLVATQKGSVVAERTYRVGNETVEPQDRLVRDLDYEMGRFFWVVDPTSLPNHPRIDPLTLDQLVIPADQRPAEVRIYRYRAVDANQGTNPNLDRKSTRLNSSHVKKSYAVFCLKKQIKGM